MISGENVHEGLSIGRAGLSDIDGIIELFYKKHPTAWIKKISRGGLTQFLEYSIGSPLCLVLMARTDGDSAAGFDSAAGYIFSTVNTGRFWLGFALRHPVTMMRIMAFRTERIREKNREWEREAVGAGDAEKPAFSWAPSGPGIARIMGILVREKHRGRGVAKSLYLTLFNMLRDRKCTLVEEYMGPDYCQFVGKYQDCGWQLQEVKGAGYKIIKHL